MLNLGSDYLCHYKRAAADKYQVVLGSVILR
jgi:hypothetical protein